MYEPELRQTSFGEWELWVNGKLLIDGSIEYVIGFGDAWYDLMTSDDDERDEWERVVSEARRTDYVGVAL